VAKPKSPRTGFFWGVVSPAGFWGWCRRVRPVGETRPPHWVWGSVPGFFWGFRRVSFAPFGNQPRHLVLGGTSLLFGGRSPPRVPTVNTGQVEIAMAVSTERWSGQNHIEGSRHAPCDPGRPRTNLTCGRRGLTPACFRTRHNFLSSSIERNISDGFADPIVPTSDPTRRDGRGWGPRPFDFVVRTHRTGPAQVREMLPPPSLRACVAKPAKVGGARACAATDFIN